MMEHHIRIVFRKGKILQWGGLQKMFEFDEVKSCHNVKLLEVVTFVRNKFALQKHPECEKRFCKGTVLNNFYTIRYRIQ